MRLRELDARFVSFAADGAMRTLDSVDGAQALSFQCPACARFCTATPDGKAFIGAHHLLLCFRNPRKASSVAAEHHGHTGWWIEGSSLDDLTFDHGTPSQAKSVGVGERNEHAHFYITRGEITDLSGNGRPRTPNLLALMDNLDTTKNPQADEPQLQEALASAVAPEVAAAAEPDPTVAGTIAPDPAVDPIAAVEAPGVSADLSTARIPAPPPIDNDHIAPGSERFSAPAADDDLDDEDLEEDDLEEDPIVDVIAIAPGYDGLRPRDVGDHFTVPASKVGRWMQVVE